MTFYGFDENSMRKLAETNRQREIQKRGRLGESPPATSSGTPVCWHRGKNNAGETIPPYSAVRISAGGLLEGKYHANLNKPSTTFSRNYALTGPKEILEGEPGGFSLEAGLAYYESGTGPQPGEMWGPKSGQYTLARGYPGFRLVAVHDSTKRLGLFHPEPIVLLSGKTDGSSVKGASVFVSIYVGNPNSPTDTGWNVIGWNDFANVASNKKCFVGFTNNQWYLTSAEC